MYYQPYSRFHIPAPMIQQQQQQTNGIQQVSHSAKSSTFQPTQIAPISPYEQLTINVPLQEYKIAKIAPIPFDPRESKGAKFINLHDALDFISKHCIVNHGFFTKSLAKKYLEFCRILDGPTGKFIVMRHFGKKEFDSAFNKIRQKNENQKFTK